MNDAPRPYECWIWTELIAFDNAQPDLGVGEYLEDAGFTGGFQPQAICLLITSPDFILSHESVREEFDLSPEYCSRDGHQFNQQRSRQVWTNYQLRRLIATLRQRGVAVYLSVFTGYYHNKYHHEWLSDHPEAAHVYKPLGRVPSVDALGGLADGSLFEDYFVPKLVETLEYYGFDGWHGADGWGPHPSGVLKRMSYSDAVVAQFAAWLPRELPAEVGGECDTDQPKIEVRADWIWQHERRAWIEFYAQRWEQFWRKAMTALHAAGKRGVINNAWTRGPFEALCTYGVDYRRLAAAGVDGFVAETVVASLSVDPGPGAAIPARHYDFLAMLLTMKAYVPNTPILFLHTVHDVVEEWDAIHHNPALLEREIYALTNVFVRGGDGALAPAANGHLVCLGDGLSPDDWRWLRSKWAQSYRELPRRTFGATLLWSDAALSAQLGDFLTTRGAPSHRLLYELMTRGVMVHTAARVENLAAVSGPLLVVNHHLLPPEELAQVLAYDRGPVILLGRGDLPESGCHFADVYSAARLSCHVFGATPAVPEVPSASEPPALPADYVDWPEPEHYWDDLTAYPVSEGFLDACALVALEVCGPPCLVGETEGATLMAAEQPDGKLLLALKNQTRVYACPQVEVGRPLREVRVLTPFPAVAIRPDGSRFRVRVPGLGVTIVEVTLEQPAD